MDRRLFLKLTGLAAVAGAAVPLPAAAQELTSRPVPPPADPQPFYAPGLYQLQGQVRLQAAVVEISGITNAQQISWAGAAPAALAGFSSFEQFDRPWRASEVTVSGGRLESLAVTPIIFA
jgi:hypothetical protein